MKFPRIVLAAVLSFLLVGQAFANAPEERILVESTKEGNWKQFLQNLSKVTMNDVKGYDPETNTIYTASVLVWVCQNQAPAWQAACANKPERFTAFKARNGWGDTITPSELQAQGQGKGIFFPFVATPVATVTPEQLKALETTFAAAQTALTAKVTENAQAVVSVREELAAKEREIATLRKELAQAPTAEAVTTLKVEIASANTARATLKKQLEAEMRTVVEAAGAAAQKAAAPAASNAAAALAATGKLGDRVTEAAAATTTALKAVDGRVSTVEGKLNTSLLSAALAALVAFFSIVLVIAFRRNQKTLVAKHVGERVAYVVDTKINDMQQRIDDVRLKVDGNTLAMGVVTESQRNSGQRLNELTAGVNVLNERVVTAEVVLGIDTSWQLTQAERDAIKAATQALATGETSPIIKLELPGKQTVAVSFEGIDEKSVFINGVDNQRRAVKKVNLFASIRAAYIRKELSGIDVPTLKLADAA